jgi:hypothetical protein
VQRQHHQGDNHLRGGDALGNKDAVQRPATIL